MRDSRWKIKSERRHAHVLSPAPLLTMLIVWEGPGPHRNALIYFFHSADLSRVFNIALGVRGMRHGDPSRSDFIFHLLYRGEGAVPMLRLYASIICLAAPRGGQTRMGRVGWPISAGHDCWLATSPDIIIRNVVCLTSASRR